MKKWLLGTSLLLAVICTICVAMLPTKAEAATYGDLTYEIADGKVTITDCNESATGELVIPNTIEGYPVTSIGHWAFSGCNRLSDITIPDSVTDIGFNAFSGCTNLTYNIYDNAKYLGNDDNPYIILMESVSDNITRCEVHSNTKFIHDRAFMGCTSLTSITIPDRVTSIGENAFMDCIRLTSVTIPDSITSIGMLAFYNCGNLSRVYITDVAAWCKIVFLDGNGNPLSNGAKLYLNGELVTNLTIPSGVTSIVDYAFWNCASLTSVTVPDSVTSIGLDAFGGCSGLVNITLPFVGNSKKTATDTYQYPFGYIFGKTNYTGSTATKQYYYGSDTSSPTYSTYYIPSSLRSVTITGGEILYGAFNNCANLTSITIPDSVTSIGPRAFQGCTNLTDMAIPAGVTSIGSFAFSECSSLTDVAIPAGVDSIAESAFGGCRSLTSVTIPGGVTSIGYTAFSGCTGLTSIVIPDGMDTIYYYAFSSCPNLNHVLFTGDEAGWDWIYFESGNNYLQNAIRHYNCTGDEIVDGVCSICILLNIPSNMTYEIVDGEVTITGCDKNASGELVIPNTIEGYPVTSIGWSAFENCSSLTSITIPDSVTSIGSSAFSGCSSLTGITIPDGVTSIDVYTFKGCSSLTSVTIGDGVTSIGISAFYGCSSLTGITIPDGVTSIGISAFFGCSSLTGVTIPDGVTSIGDHAFYGCKSLTSITIPDSVTSIGSSAFEGCSNLTHVIIGDGVTSIGDSVFWGCSSLTSITIPYSVTSISQRAFVNCFSLNHVLYTGTEAQWSNNGLYNDYFINATRHYNCTGDEIVNGVCTLCISFGDADGDGFVDAYDASLIKKYSVGAISESELNIGVLDLDGDGHVDAYDASLVQKFSVGAITKFPIEESAT